MNSSTVPGFKLRKAELSDTPLVLEFIRGLADYERLLDQCVATEEQLEKYLFSDEAVAEVFLAYQGETAVGFCLFFVNFSTFLGKPGIYLEDLFIRPEHRNKGYGSVILSFLAKLAVDRGYGRFEWSVLDWNEPAIAFYQKLGASPMDEWTVQRIEGESLHQLANQF